jgi:DNA-binding transcriptional LysR family regulator
VGDALAPALERTAKAAKAKVQLSDVAGMELRRLLDAGKLDVVVAVGTHAGMLASSRCRRRPVP